MIKSSIFPTVRQVQAVCMAVSLIPIFINFIRSIFYVILRNNDTIEHRGVTHNNVERRYVELSKGSIKCNNINNNNKVV